MQDVQTRIRLAAPFTRACTFCRFRFQRRLDTLCAWLIRLPNCGPRPHTSHTFAIIVAPWGQNPVYQFPDYPRNRSDILTTYPIPRGSRLTDFNHIHSRDGEDWVCGRSLSVRDEQMLHCEGRDPDEIEACRLCAERIIGYLGEPMHVH